MMMMMRCRFVESLPSSLGEKWCCNENDYAYDENEDGDEDDD